MSDQLRQFCQKKLIQLEYESVDFMKKCENAPTDDIDKYINQIIFNDLVSDLSYTNLCWDQIYIRNLIKLVSRSSIKQVYYQELYYKSVCTVLANVIVVQSGILINCSVREIKQMAGGILQIDAKKQDFLNVGLEIQLKQPPVHNVVQTDMIIPCGVVCTMYKSRNKQIYAYTQLHRPCLSTQYFSVEKDDNYSETKQMEINKQLALVMEVKKDLADILKQRDPELVKQYGIVLFTEDCSKKWLDCEKANLDDVMHLREGQHLSMTFADYIAGSLVCIDSSKIAADVNIFVETKQNMQLQILTSMRNWMEFLLDFARIHTTHQKLEQLQHLFTNVDYDADTCLMFRQSLD